MICSSVRIVRFIVHPFLGSDSSRSWRKNPEAGQLPWNWKKQQNMVLGTA
jgi:hypothetical protein